jgi:hypothetical protein
MQKNLLAQKEFRIKSTEMVRPKREKPSVQISVRVEPEIDAQIDALHEALKRNRTVVGKRVDVIRTALETGIQAMLDELSSAVAKPAPSAESSVIKKPSRKR